MLKKIRDKLRFLRWAYENRNMKPQEVVRFKTTEIRPQRYCVKTLIECNLYGPYTKEQVEKNLAYMIAKRIYENTETSTKDVGNGMIQFKKEFWIAPVEEDEMNGECDETCS